MAQGATSKTGSGDASLFLRYAVGLSDAQRHDVSRIRTKAQELLDDVFAAYAMNGIKSDGDQARCRSLFKTNLQQALFWAEHGLTTA